MKNIKVGDKIKISDCSLFKDNIFRRFIGKIFPSFDRSYDLNGEYVITGEYTAEKKLKTKG